MSLDKKICLACDCSGSTRFDDIYKNICHLGQNITNKYGKSIVKFIGWNSKIRHASIDTIYDMDKYYNIADTPPFTTEPQNLFLEKHYTDPNIMVLITDGRIYKENIEQMNEYIDHLDKLPNAMYCIIVDNVSRYHPIEYLNISIFTSFLKRPFVISHYDGNDERLILSNIYSCYEIPDNWDEAKVIYGTDVIEDMLQLPTINMNTFYINNDLCIPVKDETDIQKLTKDDLLILKPHWERFVFYLKFHKNLIKELRNVVHSTFKPMNKMKECVNERFDICKQLEKDKHNPDLIQKLKENTMKVQNNKNNEDTKVKQYLLEVITEQQKKTKDFSVQLLSSNRSKRATDVNHFPNIQDLSNSCPDKIQGTCTICYQQNDLWCLLRKTDYSKNTQDFVLDNPYSHNIFNSLCKDLVCEFCGNALLSLGLDHYRQEIIGMIPVFKKFPENQTYFHKAISYWLFGKIMYASWHLLNNAIISMLLENNDLIEFYTPILNEIADKLQTKPKLDGSSTENKVSLREGIKGLCNDEVMLMRKPVKSVSQLFNFLIIMNEPLPDNMDHFINLRFIKSVIETYRKKEMKVLYDILFPKNLSMTHDITKFNTISLDNVKISYPNFLNKDNGKYSIKNMKDYIHQDTLQNLKKVFCLLIMYQYTKTEKLMELYLTKDIHIDKLKETIDNQHLQSEPFITIFGPSVKKCVCGYIFKDEEDRKQHFKSVFYSSDNKKLFINSRRLIQRYFAENKVPDKLTRPIVVDILKYTFKTRYRHGDIFYPVLLEHIVTGVVSFIQVWKRTSEKDKDFFKYSYNKYSFQNIRYENRLQYENNLNIPLDHPYYDIVEPDTELAKPLSSSEYEKIKDYIKLPTIN